MGELLLGPPHGVGLSECPPLTGCPPGVAIHGYTGLMQTINACIINFVFFVYIVTLVYKDTDGS